MGAGADEQLVESECRVAVDRKLPRVAVDRMHARIENEIDLLELEECIVAKNETILRDLVEQEVLG